MPRVGFEPTIPVLERAKTVYALDCAATMIGLLYLLHQYTGCSIQTSHTLSDLRRESKNGRKMKLEKIEEQFKKIYLTH
jgi:hypothetical protein